MAKGPEFEADLHPENQRFGIVVARFNRAITKLLLNGAHEALAEHGVPTDAIDVLWVPGCFEIPLIAQRLAASGGYHAVICLGAVVRGDTAHFEHVGREAAAGIADAARTTGVPVLFGVLTTENWQQALDRAGGKEGNKGYD
ncbi:MAG TPA: 6,7-dimethyl-8-ribityllumazine synthase, partial [Chloroflexota bacterium]